MSSNLGRSGDSSHCPDVLVLGLGNTILTDDGVGIYAARLVRERVDDFCVAVKEASMGGLELLELMRGFKRVILVDAIFTGNSSPGSLVRMKAEELRSGSALSRHQISLPEALGLAESLNIEVPKEIIIYGIEAQDVYTFSESCTPEIEKSLPDVADAIVQEAMQLTECDKKE